MRNRSGIRWTDVVCVAGAALLGCGKSSSAVDETDAAVPNDAAVVAPDATVSNDAAPGPSDAAPNGDATAPGLGLRADPPRVVLDRTEMGQTATASLRLVNEGATAVGLRGLTIRGGTGFSVTLHNGGAIPTADMLIDPDGDGTPGLSSGAAMLLNVALSPDTPPPHTAVLVAIPETGAPLEIPLTDTPPGTCLTVNPGALDFRAPLGGQATQTLTLGGCGDTETHVARVDFAGAGQARFRLAADAPNLPLTVAAGVSTPLPVLYEPAFPQSDEAQLVLTLDTPDSRTLTVPLHGVGAQNECPVPVVAQGEFHVAPGETVNLDGAGSIDVDGSTGHPIRYEWVVTERPEGSTAQPAERYQDPSDPLQTAFPDNTSTPGCLFFADLAGTYTLELRVTDELGLNSSSCPRVDTSTVTIVAGNNGQNDLVVHLTTAPADGSVPDPAHLPDTELHLLAPRADAAFLDPVLDCSATNPAPEWGDAAANDNPVFTPAQDDAPQAIFVAAAENTATTGHPYTVGVHYLADPGVGAVMASVAIICRGQVVTPPDGLRVLLPAQDAFAVVADVDLPSCALSPHLDVTPHPPGP